MTTQLRRAPVSLFLCGLTLAISACSGPSTASTTPGPASPAAIRLGDAADHTTVSVPLGATVILTLGSTYWSAPVSSVPGVLSSTASASASADHGCMAGMGCGTLQDVLRAADPGTTQLSSSRVSCGEAMSCPPDRRRFTVTVIVAQ